MTQPVKFLSCPLITVAVVLSGPVAGPWETDLCMLFTKAFSCPPTHP